MFDFIAQDPQSKARCGRLTTGRGVVETPAFLPVETQGSVKAMSPRELWESAYRWAVQRQVLAAAAG